MNNPFSHLFGQILIEFPAHRIGFENLIRRLEKAGVTLDHRLENMSDRSTNRKILARIIRGERWSQRRMSVTLGELVPHDRPEDYQPEYSDWHALRAAFHTTRQKTISLCKTLRMAGVDPQTCIFHDRWGEISLLGWVYYLNLRVTLQNIQFN
jgi:hypothetical protein